MSPVLRYSRTGGGRPPPDRELLEVDDDGGFTMWRSLAIASEPPTPVGRFAGRLDDDHRAGLLADVRAAAREGDLSLDVPPGGARERVVVEGAEAVLGHHGKPDGAWGQLLYRVRALLASLASQPRAAIALRIRADGAELVHEGSEALPVDLSKLSARLVHWQAAEVVGERHFEAPAALEESSPTQGEVGPGWRGWLPFDEGLELAADSELDVYVTFRVRDGRTRVTAQLFGTWAPDSDS